MKLSLVLATCDRANVIKDCLQSINEIVLGDFELELIIVDQSFDSDTFDIVNKISWNIDVTYFHTLKKGLSYSRNIGIEICDGDYIFLGDDDATYSSCLLSKLKFYLGKYELISCGVYEPQSNILSNYTKVKNQHNINRLNFCELITSISIFFKKDFIENNDIMFDESLGLGAKFPSCEEVDFVYNILSHNGKGYYTPDISVYHASPNGYDDNKTYLYALGHGAFCRKILSYRGLYSYLYITKKIFKTLCKLPVSLISPKYKGYVFFKGFKEGFQRYKS